MKLRRARRARKGRIEIIPMIDVMFFLLATFMLASLSMQNLNSLQVNLPHGRADSELVKKDITLTITKENAIYLNMTPVTLETLPQTLAPLMYGHEGRIIVAADGGALQGVVVKAMLKAREAGGSRFLIAVRRDEQS